MPLREGYQGDDYPVGIISYDSNIMKYQLSVLIHPLKVPFQSVNNECSPQDRLLLMFGSLARTTNAYSPNPQFSLCIFLSPLTQPPLQ